MATPAFVQQASATTATPGTLAFSSNNGAGNLLVVWLYSSIAAVSLTCQDTNNGNVYTPAFAARSDGTEFFGCFYLANCNAGANTIQWAAPSGAFVRGVIAEYSGIKTSSPLDGTPVVVASSGTATMTTLTNNDLILGLSVGQTVTAAGSGYTIRANVAAGTLVLEDNAGPPLTANSAGSNTASVSSLPAGSFAVVAFAAAPAPAPAGGTGGWLNAQNDYTNKRGVEW